MKLLAGAITGQFPAAFKKIYGTIVDASHGGLSQLADELKTEARAAIAGAGFSKRWQNTLRVNLYPKRPVTANGAVYLYHKIPYAGVFETGATIRGKPFMWLPTSNAPKSVGFNKKVDPINYQRFVGPLRFAQGKHPMLVAEKTVGRKNKRQVSVVMFVGVPLVKIPKKFDIAKITERKRSQLASFYFNHLKA